MKYLLILSLLLSLAEADAQFSRDSIYSDFVLYQRRTDFDQYLRNNTIQKTFSSGFDKNQEDYYREACWTISQFLLDNTTIQQGMDMLLEHYQELQYDTKRALLEAIYGVYPQRFSNRIATLIQTETQQKLFAMQAAYLFRQNPGQWQEYIRRQTSTLVQQTGTASPLLEELLKWMDNYQQPISTPPLADLFTQQHQLGKKMIYSLQRQDRDQPGLAIVQDADGHFVRDENGHLQVFAQLARSASNLPYFITNGSTPQGLFSIQGTAVSNNKFIGPTPNIQLVMPFENDSVYWHGRYDSSRTALDNYRQLLPESWQQYAPITEVLYAGKIGRTEIIAHGTTIDPDYFRDKPYYPLTPTMGCLCAREIWNIFSGRINQSDQLQLANSMISSKGDDGWLIVVNIDNQHKPVSREEIEKIVDDWEKSRR